MKVVRQFSCLAGIYEIHDVWQKTLFTSDRKSSTLIGNRM